VPVTSWAVATAITATTAKARPPRSPRVEWTILLVRGVDHAVTAARGGDAPVGAVIPARGGDAFGTW
jgi:hypothetical protein